MLINFKSRWLECLSQPRTTMTATFDKLNSDAVLTDEKILTTLDTFRKWSENHSVHYLVEDDDESKMEENPFHVCSDKFETLKLVENPKYFQKIACQPKPIVRKESIKPIKETGPRHSSLMKTVPPPPPVGPPPSLKNETPPVTTSEVETTTLNDTEDEKNEYYSAETNSVGDEIDSGAESLNKFRSVSKDLTHRKSLALAANKNSRRKSSSGRKSIAGRRSSASSPSHHHHHSSGNKFKATGQDVGRKKSILKKMGGSLTKIYDRNFSNSVVKRNTEANGQTAHEQC